MPARIDDLRETLGQLHQHLEENEELDAELRSELRGAAEEIHDALEASGTGSPEIAESVSERLRDSIARFEGSHPTLTGIAGRIVDALADIGI